MQFGGLTWARIGHDQALRANLTGSSPRLSIYSAGVQVPVRPSKPPRYSGQELYNRLTRTKDHRLIPSMRTTGAHDDRTTSAGSRRCLRSCKPAVVRPRCCTFCCRSMSRLTSIMRRTSWRSGAGM